MTAEEWGEQAGNNDEVINYLKQEEKKSRAIDKFDFKSSFEQALKNNDLYSMKYIFMVKKISFNHKLDENNSFLHHAAENGSLSFVEYLVDNGLDPNERNQAGITPIHLAAKNSLEILRYLIAKGGDVNAKTKTQKKTIHFAAESGQLDILKYLIKELKMDPNEATNDGQQPIHYASSNGHLNIVKVRSKRLFELIDVN